jgi:hypothetical protein
MTEATHRDRPALRDRSRIALAAAVLTLLAAPTTGRATALGLLGGHLSVGYAQLAIGGAPAGSISFTGGMDLPVRPTLKAGIDLGYDLLGSHAVDRGSLSANVSYSAFEAVAFAHWLPEHLGPIGRVSVGPMLMAAHADIAAAAGGAGFSDLAVGETAPGVAGEVTLISRANLPSGSTPPVRLGFQMGGRAAFLRHDTWTVLSARLTIHY